LLFTSRNTLAAFVTLVIEVIKLVVISPKMIEVQLINFNRDNFSQFIEREAVVATVVIIVLYPCFVFFFEGFMTQERIVNETQTRLEAANESLKDSLKQRELFILSLSHEVRNPLNVVLGNVELCYEEASDPGLKERLRNAKICGEMLLSLINNVLDVGKADLDNVEVCSTDTPIRPLFEKIWFSCREIIKNKGLKATMTGLERLPPILKLDQYRLTQILFNLISNAVKFTDKGEIRLNLYWYEGYAKVGEEQEENLYTEGCLEGHPSEMPSSKNASLVGTPKDNIFIKQNISHDNFGEEEGVLEIEVTDTGAGISAEGLKSLFQKFSQVSSVTNQRKLGTGLGLFITKKICEKMGGEITVSSQVDKGTVFSVRINTKKCPMQIRIPASLVLNTDMPTSIEKHKVMIVEDVFFNADIIQKFVTDGRDFEVVKIAENGQVAVNYYEDRILSNDPIHLITMDLEMPVMGGKEACKKIRELEKQYHLPSCHIVIISGNCLESEVSECLNPEGEIKACKFIRKPVRKEEFRSLMCDLSKSLMPLTRDPKASKGQILVVDDDKFNQALVVGMLKKMNIRTCSANNGKEALELFMKDHKEIDIILMDCEMSIMDGWTATKAIKNFCKEKKIISPIIYGLTGYNDREIEQRCLDCGMREMIKKPISFGELMRKISL
jgi:signal transduction histidine kinase/response regulator RpfG family c-di-GMP phosphodiesterase